MNKAMREYVSKITVNIEKMIEMLEIIKDDEENKRDNYPENLQSTETYENMERAVDCMDDAIESLNSAVESLDEI